ncbi:MAG: hypothetical protein AAB320_02205 [Elusimicrobiota bacterium]
MSLPLALVLLLAVAPARAAEPAKKNPGMRVQFIGERSSKGPAAGESGAYTHPSPEASDAMETIARQHPKPEPVAAPAPRKVPVYPRRARPASAPAAKAEREDSPQERKRYSLWEGLAAPLALASDKVKDVSDDEAAGMGREDYESHILSRSESPAQGAALAAAPAPAPEPAIAKASDAPKPEVFVSVDFDLKGHEIQYKDAVADLTRMAGFRQDRRFEPSASAADRVSLWGWISPDRLGDAMKVASVQRLRVDAGIARQGARAGAVTDVLIGIRVPDAGSAREVSERVLKTLAAEGFRWKRTIGTQQAPGSSQMVVVVEGVSPITALSKLLGHPELVKIVPAPEAALREEPAPRSLWQPAEFLAYATDRSPWLLLITLLLVLPPLGGGLLRLAEFFIPYSR